MTNPAFKEMLLKISQTQHDLEDRAAALSATGVPENFNVEYSALEEDSVSAERKVHQVLSHARAIEAATVKRFPMLKLHKGWGINAQNLEGAMLRVVMLKGVEKDIVVLPVHDAVAVQQGDES
jgi:hypothetical protein